MSASGSEAAGGEKRFIAGFADRLRSLGIEPARLIYAFNIAVAAIFALYFAFLVNLQNTFWALLTIPLVLKQQSGLTVWRSFARFVGTMTGALIGLAFVSFFAQDGPTMIAALSLWLFATGVLARFEIGIDAYAYGVAGLTTLIIAMDTGPQADMAFTYAVSRTTETVIAIVSGFVVVLVVFPQSIVPVVSQSIGQAREKVMEVVRKAIERESEPPTVLRKEVAEALRQTYTNLRAWRFETSPNQGALPRLRTETSILNDIAAAAEALAFVARSLEEGDAAPPSVTHAQKRLMDLIADLPGEDADAEVISERAKALADYAEEMRREADLDDSESDPSSTGVAEASVLFRLSQLADHLAAFLQVKAADIDPERHVRTIPPGRTRYVDPIAAIQLGLRPALAFFVMANFWLASAWAPGRILALITGALSLMIPTLVPRAMLPMAGRKIALGFLSMVPIALLLMAVLPSMQTFAGFAAVVGSVIFVLFYVCSEQQNQPLAIGGTVMLAIGLQPSNQPVYDPLQLITTGATLALMPVAFVASVMILFPNTPQRVRRHLKRGTDDLLSKAAGGRIDRVDFLGQNIDLLADYGGDLDMADEASRPYVERARSATQVGLELFALREAGATRLFPKVDDRIARAAISASRRSADETPDEETGMLRKIVDETRERLARLEEQDQAAAHRVIMAAELTRALIEQRRIALPGRSA